MARDSAGPFQGKLEDCGSGASQQVGPVDGIDVVGLGELLARVSLPCQAAMFRVVQLDDQPPDGLATLLHIYQDSSAAIGQPIQCVHIMDHDDLAAHLEPQFSHEGGVLYAACIVCLERRHRPAGILGLYDEELPVYLLQLGIVSGIHFGVGAINVESVAVEGGIRPRENPCLKGSNVLLRLLACPHSVEQVSVNLVFTLAMVLLKVDHCEEPPQVSQLARQGMLLVGGYVKDVSCLGRLELVEVAKEKDGDTSKNCVKSPSYLSQSEVDVVEHVSRYHTDLVNYEASQVPEQDPLLIPLLLWH